MPCDGCHTRSSFASCLCSGQLENWLHATSEAGTCPARAMIRKASQDHAGASPACSAVPAILQRSLTLNKSRRDVVEDSFLGASSSHGSLGFAGLPASSSGSLDLASFAAGSLSCVSGKGFGKRSFDPPTPARPEAQTARRLKVCQLSSKGQPVFSVLRRLLRDG